jgi:hypothetical protein
MPARIVDPCHVMTHNPGVAGEKVSALPMKELASKNTLSRAMGCMHRHTS